jgi:hypothetical protein
VIANNQFENSGVVRFAGTANKLISVTGNAFNHAGLVLPSRTASQVNVTGNTRYGSEETDLSGAEVVFGNKGFGNDRTENSLEVNGNLTAPHLKTKGISDGGEVDVSNNIKLYCQQTGSTLEVGYVLDIKANPPVANGGSILCIDETIYPKNFLSGTFSSKSGNWQVPKGWYNMGTNSVKGTEYGQYNGVSDGSVCMMNSGLIGTTIHYRRY